MSRGTGAAAAPVAGPIKIAPQYESFYTVPIFTSTDKDAGDAPNSYTYYKIVFLLAIFYNWLSFSKLVSIDFILELLTHKTFI